MNTTLVGMNNGELELYNSLKRDESSDFIVIPNMMFNKKENGSNQIDLLVICSRGIFVYEMKDYKGWIFGNEYNKEWTQVLRGKNNSSKKYKFQNPIKQNENHIKTIKGILSENDLNLPIYNIVVFGEEGIFKNVEVTSDVIHIKEAKAVIDKYPEILISTAQLDNIKNYLLARNIIDLESRAEHIEYASSFKRKKAIKTNKDNETNSNQKLDITKVPDHNRVKKGNEFFSILLTRRNALLTCILAVLAVAFLNNGFLSLVLSTLAIALMTKIKLEKYVPWLMILVVMLVITLNIGKGPTSNNYLEQYLVESESNVIQNSVVTSKVNTNNNDSQMVNQVGKADKDSKNNVTNNGNDNSTKVSTEVKSEVEIEEIEIVSEEEIDDIEVEVILEELVDDTIVVEVIVDNVIEDVEESDISIDSDDELNSGDNLVETETEVQIEISDDLFFIGSEQSKVQEVMGNPDSIFDEYLWIYGDSKIYFNNQGEIISYSNRLNGLTDYLPKGNVNATSIFIGSTKIEVLKKAGAPSNLNGEIPNTWNYGDSKIYFNKQGEVFSYSNRYNNLTNYLPKGNLNTTKVFIGSTKEEVLKIVGAPTSFNGEEPNIWIYGDSKIYFDELDKIISYSNRFNGLTKILPVKNLSMEIVFIGSSKNEVLEKAGAPISVYAENPNVWNYGDSNIHFSDQGFMDSYNNLYKSLTNILPSAKETEELIIQGLSKEEVLNIQGAPTSINENTPNVWYYSSSFIKFENDRVIEWKNSYNTLKVEEN